MKTLKYFILICFFTELSLCSNSSFATCIVIYIKNDSMFIGVDSKVVLFHVTGWTEEKFQCKLKSTNNIYYTFTGVSDTSQLDIFKIASTVCQNIKNIDSVSIKFASLYSAALYKYLKTEIGKKSFKNEDQPLNAIFCGLQLGEPYLVLLTFNFNSDPKVSNFITVEKQSIKLKNTGYSLLGAYDSINSFLSINPNFLDQNYGTQLIDSLITMEAESRPDIVGKPISILCMTRHGIFWTQKTNLCN